MNQELGSLAQSARGNQLKSARWIMIFVGVLTIAINGYVFATNDATLDQEVAQLKAEGFEIDEAELANISFINKVTSGSFAATGVLFILLGLLVYQFPVPCTVTGLVLYVGAIGVGLLLNPLSVFQGIIVKILIIVGLVKSVQSAFAYTNEA